MGLSCIPLALCEYFYCVLLVFIYFIKHLKNKNNFTNCRFGTSINQLCIIEMRPNIVQDTIDPKNANIITLVSLALQ